MIIINTYSLPHYFIQEETARHRFQSLGGIQYLSSLKMVAPLDIVPVISELIQKLQPCYIEEKSEDHIKQVRLSASLKDILPEHNPYIYLSICRGGGKEGRDTGRI